jgi:putative salt-induced outer membrane protein YdiY
MKANLLGTISAICLLAYAIPAFAQAPAGAAPPQTYTGSFGAGLAITGGNTDTVNFNLTFDLTRDPKKKNVFKANALYLRSDANNETTADRLLFGFRDEYSLSKKVFVYGAIAYLRDPFKEISYMINPQGGFGYKLVATDKHTFSLNGGAGGVWEKDTGLDVQGSGTLNAGQSYAYKLSDATSLTQVFGALWKTSDFNDAFYHFGIALVTSITKKIQVKVEFMDDYKNVTPRPAIKNNDTAFITSFLYKF